METFYVKAPRLMSNGTVPHGYPYGGNVYFDRGITGPHIKNAVQWMQTFVGGTVLTKEEGDAYLAALDAGANPKDVFLGKFKSFNNEPKLEVGDFESVGYSKAMKIMSENGFDWLNIGGGRSRGAVKYAWEKFTGIDVSLPTG